jgi:hypothetical protein
VCGCQYCVGENRNHEVIVWTIGENVSLMGRASLGAFKLERTKLFASSFLLPWCPSIYYFQYLYIN